jgi:3-phenylpropionate/trans-cinnamate dioxygenase ferredoxin reductase subunit
VSGDGLVIVGGSYAAMQTAASARDAGYAGKIRLVTDETQLPYQRPPLSKGFLLGAMQESALPLRAEAFYRDNAIELVLDTRVEAIDRTAKRVLTTDGRRLPYDCLALAVGARARTLAVPGIDLDGVAVLRSLDDARQIRSRLPEVESAVIVGAGFIGLEVASALTSFGKDVTVIEAQERVLARAASAPLAHFVGEAHRRKGVRLHLRTTVRAIQGERGRVRSVICSDDSVHPADLVVIGIGIAPNIELAAAAGLSCPNGVEVDAFGRSSDPCVIAAGDCTCHPSAYAGRLLRLESVQNALDQAKTAGATIAGARKSYDAIPWFWSDQHDLKLQMAGLSRDYDVSAVRGRPEEGGFSIYYFRDDALIAVDSVNRPGDHVIARKLLASRVRLTPAEAVDASLDLRARLDS